VRGGDTSATCATLTRPPFATIHALPGRLAGATVRILAGPNAGTSATTDARGEFRFTEAFPANSSIMLEAVFRDYERDVIRGLNLINSTAPGGHCTSTSITFFLGQAPHRVYGVVSEAGSNGARPIGNARVGILDGPNAGASVVTNSAGEYRMEGLATSEDFTMQAAARAIDPLEFALRKNTQVPMPLSPE
jgi:hypothetical protein